MPSRPAPGGGLSAFLRTAPVGHLSEFRKVALSKRLAYLLRHEGPEHNVHIALDGYADLHAVLASLPMQVLIATNDVHVALGLKGDERVKSGMRDDCDVYDGQACNSGLELDKSDNYVILSPGVNGVVPSNFLWATDASGQELLRFGTMTPSARQVGAASQGAQASRARPGTPHTPASSSSGTLHVQPWAGLPNLMCKPVAVDVC
jgi:RNA 2'-phosphotransferase, Tpt1 / KptA family